MINYCPGDGHNIGQVLVQRAGDGGGGVVVLVAELVGVDVAGAQSLLVPVLVLLQTQPPAPHQSAIHSNLIMVLSPGFVYILKKTKNVN